MEVHHDLSTGRYLGLPLLIGRSKKTVFSFLKDRMCRKIQGWSSKFLSKAGKAVLLRNVAQAVPTYNMSCFLLPKSLCEELQRMMNNFLWGSGKDLNKGIRWLSWENMSMAKCRGGMGFRDLHGFNLVLLDKHYWNFINKPNSLVARVFNAKYFPIVRLLMPHGGEVLALFGSAFGRLKKCLKKDFRLILGN